MDEEEAKRLFPTPTVNVGTFDGGGTVNRVPESATAELDIRLTAGVHPPSILSQIEESLEGHPAVEIADGSRSIGTDEPFDSPLLEATAQRAESVADDPIYRRSAAGSGDAKTVCNEGFITIEFVYETETAHAVDEYTTIESLQKNVDVFTTLPFGFAVLTDEVGTTGA